MLTFRTTRLLLLSALIVALVAPVGQTAASATCAGPAAGGEWRAYGSDLQNTRAQPFETSLDDSNIAGLAPDFIFRVSQHGSGIIHGTPIVADGCVYVGTTTGHVFAVNAETGDLVWETKLDVQNSGLLCTGVVSSPAVVDGRVIVNVSQASAPYTVALDQATGVELWRTTMDTTPLVYNCASPVVHDGIVIAAFTGDQTGALNRGGFALLDLEDGAVLARTYTIPEEDLDEHKGGGIWSTPAIDIERGYAYAGTSNPDAGTMEHQNTNAIVKFDIARARDAGGTPVPSSEITNPAFGQIVAAYKGNPDRYLDLPHPPTCNPDPAINVYARSVICMQMDLDFGASPQLLSGPDGALRVGNLQKAGVYHVADAISMERIWTTIVAPPFFYSNGSTAATDGTSIFVAGSPPGQMFSLAADDGLYEWAAPIADLLHYQGIAYANGLVYSNDAKGFLNVYRASDGVPVLQRPVFQDVGLSFYAEVSSGSTAIARNTVYVAVSGFVVAYRA